MLITFEGIDGCGKTTQINLLKKYLTERNIDFITIREPGGTPLSEKIRELLLDKNLQLSAETELFLFSAARSHLVENIIRPELNLGKIVICDRFFDSTTAYQSFGRNISLDIVNQINILATKNLIPDLTFYIHISLEEHKKRNLNRKSDRIESSGDSFFKQVIDGYLLLQEKFSDRIYKINSQEKILDTFNQILNIFELKYNNFKKGKYDK